MLRLAKWWNISTVVSRLFDNVRTMQRKQTENFVRRRAPFIGEHNNEIYMKELGLSVGEVEGLKTSGVI
jgi:crotonobetainyl-CoA:carnitine CoA-transferase CaiB-like acyl-CoA transferase